MADGFGPLSVPVARALHDQRDAVLAGWAKKCDADDRVRSDETIPSPAAIVDALGEGLERPQPVSSAPDEIVSRVAALFVDFDPLITVASRQLLYLEDAILEHLPDALEPDETTEVRARAHVLTAWVITHVSAVRLRGIALEALRHPLTRLFSKVAFEQDLEVELGTASETGANCFVIAIDLDDFKRINDTRGHAEGDRALKRFAASLADAVGARGAAYHLSGDEFAVILREGSPEEVVEKAQETAQVA